VDRILSLALTVDTPTGCGLGRGFLLGLDQLDGDSQRALMVLVQGIVEAPLLGRVEQGAVGRVQVQQPMVAVDGNQGAVGGNTAGHAGDRQFREQFQPLQRQAGGRGCRGFCFGLGGRFGGVFAGQIVQVTVGRIHVRLDVVFVQRRLVVEVDAWGCGFNLGDCRLGNRC